jgi:hypothetical protein
MCLPKARSWITTAYALAFFVLNSLRWEVIICFADIGGIVDHHCLNYLSVILFRGIWYVIIGASVCCTIFTICFSGVIIYTHIKLREQKQKMLPVTTKEWQWNPIVLFKDTDN